MPYHDDDGNELNPDLIPVPGLCVVCQSYNDPDELIECNLARLDQHNDAEFICCAFLPIDSADA